MTLSLKNTPWGRVWRPSGSEVRQTADRSFEVRADFEDPATGRIFNTALSFREEPSEAELAERIERERQRIEARLALEAQTVAEEEEEAL